ncbi:hypothetical protein [Motiliproteus sp. MSK22-1]|uniref:hypothetical protein n=1 Tax=Motiliproteus sp. MSK22-1 TaxID=1897630 RepID=UPI000977214D|nr:hypothetical protein [Motiliproteus sp. MSK22-1]OMH34782.1 hypothetical protein BGP75_10780 [Motiliproteus sp. MSK22-1]
MAKNSVGRIIRQFSIAVVFGAGCCSPYAIADTELAVNASSPIGLNITGVNYWSSQWMLLDLMKQGSDGSGHSWTTSSPATYNTLEHDKLDLDQNGWPRTLPDTDDTSQEYRYVTSLLLHDNQHYEPGEYIVLYEGAGEIRYSGPRKIEERSSPGRDVVQLDPNSFFHLQIRSTDPDQTGNYIRNIRVIVPGGICDDNPFLYGRSAADCATSFTAFEEIYQSQRFHPLFLADMSKFRSLRFMQYQSTNVNQQRFWDQRTQMESATWAGDGGGPIELALELSNKIKAEPWLNVPARASDEYIREFADLVRTNLAEDLSVYVELGNEIWNSAYPYILDARWMEEQGKLLWPEAGVSDFGYRLNYYGKRTADMCSIWKDAFADQSDRVKCVMGGQGGNSWVSYQSLSCPLWVASGGDVCATDMHSLAIGPYFAGYFYQDRFLSFWSQWLEEGSAVDKVFEEINDGILRDLTWDPSEQEWQRPPEGGALAGTARHIQSNAQVAAEFGIQLTAYEGGQHMTFAGNMEGDREVVNQQVFLAANRDPRMGEAFGRHFDDWQNSGGNLYMVFESIGRWGRFGAFPLKEYQTQTNAEAPKFQAVIDYIDNHPCWWEGCARDVYLDTNPGTEQPDDPTDPNDPDNDTGENNVLTLQLSSLPDTWGVRLTWDQLDGEVAYYGVYKDGEWVGHTVAETSFDVNWLQLGHSYSFHVEALNSAKEILATSTVESSMAGDSEAPTQPQELVAVSDGGWGFNLRWNASIDNTGVAYYKISRNGQPYTHTSASSFHDPWPPQGEVIYQITAYDNYHNASISSETVTAVQPSN